ncbi:MAG: SDR family NAD(P)-dependent oxidoreductase [Bacteroidetes bacterium]|nr:SDR family NAD(P)-dependent oxidoreductase [Bacteroidota bacterium]
MKDKVWFITGCSTGFGRELSLMALEMGYRVAVASRNLADIEDITNKYKERALAVQLDMTKPAELKDSVDKILNAFGRIDILVNNAGIGYFASMEESKEAEVRKMFEVNFFGLTALTQHVLPTMRKQKSGHIVNVSSIGGLVGFPAVSFYNATKFAVAGLSEALAKETAHLGISVTIVCPSGFRTDWAGRSANEDSVEIEDYKETAGANRNNIRNNSGKQAGDPVRAAKEIIAMTESEKHPLYLLLGTASYNAAKKKLQDLENNFDAWKDAAINSDFPKG